MNWRGILRACSFFLDMTLMRADRQSRKETYRGHILRHECKNISEEIKVDEKRICHQQEPSLWPSNNAIQRPLLYLKIHLDITMNTWKLFENCYGLMHSLLLLVHNLSGQLLQGWLKNSGICLIVAAYCHSKFTWHFWSLASQVITVKYILFI